jgi:capsular exopolysaccharide synthesis family protein
LYGSRENGKVYTTPMGTEPGLKPGPGMPVETAEDEYILSLRDFLRVIRRRLWVISMVAIVLTGATVAFNLVQKPMYEASIRILVGQERGTSETLAVGVYDLQALTQTMASGVSSRPVAEATIQQLGLRITPEQFLANLSAKQDGETQFIQVSYTDPSPERAQRVVNTTGDVFSKQISQVSPSASAITATVWERAVAPDEPISPNPVRNGLLVLVVGLGFGVGLALLLEYLDDSWDSPEEMEEVSGAPTFGIIPRLEVLKSQDNGVGAMVGAPLKTEGRQAKSKSEADGLDELAGRLVTVFDPMSGAAEAYRTLRTNLLYTAYVEEPVKTIVLTSPGPGEGKSTTCANLGVVLAQAAKEVLIVDCDFRKPVMHKFFGLGNLHGIVDVFAGTRKGQEIWMEPRAGLKVIPAGLVPPDPTELLSTQRFAELLASFRESFDYVLVDAPPAGTVSDAAILATQGDGVLLVSDAQETRKESVRQAVRSLEAVGARILGTVMNNAKAAQRDYSHTY